MARFTRQIHVDTFVLTIERVEALRGEKLWSRLETDDRHVDDRVARACASGWAASSLRVVVDAERDRLGGGGFAGAGDARRGGVATVF
jgi:hypothetical protein